MGRILLERTKKYLFIPYEEGTVDQKIQIRGKSKKISPFITLLPPAMSVAGGELNSQLRWLGKQWRLLQSVMQ